MYLLWKPNILYLYITYKLNKKVNYSSYVYLSYNYITHMGARRARHTHTHTHTHKERGRERENTK